MSSAQEGPSTLARPARDSGSVSELPAEPARDSLRRIGVGRSVERVVGVGGGADAIDHQRTTTERVVVAEGYAMLPRFSGPLLNTVVFLGGCSDAVSVVDRLKHLLTGPLFFL